MKFSYPFAILHRLPFLFLGIFCSLSNLPLAAMETSYRLDLTPGAVPSGGLPSWLREEQIPQGPLAQISYTLQPPYPQGSELFLTIIFEEAPQSFLRVYRETTTSAETLSDNLLEGVLGLNQRTLHLKNIIPELEHRITLQSGSRQLPVRQLHWQWVKPRTILAEESVGPLVALRASLILRGEEIEGGLLSTPLLQLQPQPHYTAAPLQEKPEPLGTGIAFLIVVNEVPTHVRLAAQLLTTRIGDHLGCWVNGQRVQAALPQPPSLSDPGYLSEVGNAAALSYAGWLPVSLYLPGAAWQLGENLLEMRPLDSKGQESDRPQTIKDSVLEFRFTPSTLTPVPAEVLADEPAEATATP
jgi:hypothetical protein